MRWIPGRLLVMTGAAGAAGLALGAAADGTSWVIAAVAVSSAAYACRQLARREDSPAGPGGRVVAWATVGLAGIAGTLTAPLGAWAIALLGAVIASAAAVEAAMFPDLQMLTLSRELPKRLSLGVPNEIALRITNNGRIPVHLEVRDRAPFELIPTKQPAAFVLQPGVTAVHRYDVTPPARGAHTFDVVDLRVTRFPGLVRRTATLPVPGATHVYPNLRDVSRYALLLHRRRTHMLGIKVARKRGKGTEFDTLREYQADDEYRDISWKASARAGKLLTQTFQVERSQNVMILVEAGRMMSAQVDHDGRTPPEKRLTKLDHAINAALVLAQAAALKEDRVGVLAFAETVKAFRAPKRGRAQLTTIVDALHDLEPTLCEPDFAMAFQTLKARAKRRSLVCLFTDVLDEESARVLTATLPLLLPQHLPLVVAVSDPTIAEMAHAVPYSGQEAFTGAVASELLHERRDILRRLRMRGALVLDVAPGELTAAVVNKYLEVKARNLL